MNLMSCHGFLNNKDPVVKLKIPKMMFEYYFSKGFTYFDCTINNLEKLPFKVKQRTRSEDTDNSDKLIIYFTTIPSTLNTMKNLAVNTHFCSSCIENELNNIKEDIINIFSEYVEPLMKEINQLELLQEWKINLDVANYERNIDNKFNRFDSDKFWPTSI